jgi:hypothetical protein
MKGFRQHITLPRLGVFAAIGMLGFGLASCGAHQSAPEPSPSDIMDGAHTQVIRMPDGFRNVAVTCDGTTAVYVSSRGVGTAGDGTQVSSGLAIEPNSPRCKGASK